MSSTHDKHLDFQPLNEKHRTPRPQARVSVAMGQWIMVQQFERAIDTFVLELQKSGRFSREDIRAIDQAYTKAIKHHVVDHSCPEHKVVVHNGCPLCMGVTAYWNDVMTTEDR